MSLCSISRLLIKVNAMLFLGILTILSLVVIGSVIFVLKDQNKIPENKASNTDAPLEKRLSHLEDKLIKNERI